MAEGTIAWEEALASVPAAILIYHTLELQHPGFVSSGYEIPIRAVTGVHEEMQFGIEDGAVFDAGEMATFMAIPFFAEYPEFAEGRTPESRIIIDGVAREIMPHIIAAMQFRADLKAIYREYRSDDLVLPCYGPVEFVVRNIIVKGASVEGFARLDNLATKKFPSMIYTIQDFPGLQP